MPKVLPNIGLTTSEYGDDRVDRNFEIIDEKWVNTDAGLRQDVDDLTTQMADIVTNLRNFPRNSGEAEDAPRLQRAINSLRLIGGTILLQDTNYIWSSGITTYNNIKIKGFNTIIDCSGVPAGTPAILVNGVYTGGAIRYGYLNILEGLHFKGKSTVSDNPVSYTTNSIGIEFASSHLKVKECTFTGFDKTTKFLTNSYIITFEECMFSYNNYGVHFDYTGQSNLGEKILFRGCTIGNNNYGIYNNLGELIFEQCSIDYNRINHVADNITDISGYASSVMILNDCHFELTATYNPSSNPRLINNGKMIIKGGAVWDDLATTFVQNNNYLMLDNLLWRISEDGNYYISGTGRILVGKLFPIAQDQNIRLTSSLSRVRNGNFEKGDLTGWVFGDVSTSANIKVVTGNAFKGTYSLSVSSLGQFNGGYVLSQKHALSGQEQIAQLTFYSKNTTNGNLFVHLTFFDSVGNQLDDTFQTIAGGASSYTRQKITWNVPVGASSYQIQANVNANLTGSAYLDEFYLMFN